MVKMKINSEFEDLQISRLNEFFLVADRIRKAGCGTRQGLGKFKCNQPNPSGSGGARASFSTSNEISSIANGSSNPPAQGSCEAPSTPSTSLSGSSLSKGGKNASQAPTDPATFGDPTRCRFLGKDAQANSPRSDGGSREGWPQWSSSPITHRDISTQITLSTAGASGNFSLTQVPPKNTSPLPHILEFFYAIVGQGSGLESLGAAAARQVVKEDLSTARAKEPNERSAIRRKSATPTTAPPNPILITHPSSGPGTTSPTGGDTQGLSPVDYNLELEAEFPKDMVFKMQGNIAKKTRKAVIGRTLGGRITFKALHECLKLHLLASFIFAMLLTRGYFLILFENEEGAIVTRKLTTVEWSGLSLSFSRYTPNFDASTQGAKALLMHMIKIQFPDLHEQFRNVRALTIMASKIDEVLDIEAADFYMKRLAGPMVTIEVKEISKPAGYIRIPSMANGASATNTIRQRIFYLGLPNQY
ncbi:unnamed protein product [Sphagnum troendelagicum]|uniref:Uncharacterized protein n=1 Tax=Sphagnum troendelagicum TaxID=128251 RepID=A0ABP0U9X2_9BRYO